MWEGPAYYGWWHPWGGGLNCIKEQVEQVVGEQAGKQCSSMVSISVSVPAQTSLSGLQW